MPLGSWSFVLTLKTVALTESVVSTSSNVRVPEAVNAALDSVKLLALLSTVSRRNTGASLVPVTVTVTVPSSVSDAKSVARTVNVTSRVSPAAKSSKSLPGSKLITPLELTDALPSLGPLVISYVSVSSASSSVTATVPVATGPSSVAAIVLSSTIGTSLVPVTFTVTVRRVISNWSS